MNKRIIGISGYAKSGKDEIAEYIQNIAQHPNDSAMGFPTWEIRKFGGKLKQMASLLLGVEMSKFEDQDYKDSDLPGWGMTVRTFLQKLGAEGLRDNLHEDIWIKALFADYKSPLVDSTGSVTTTMSNGNRVSWMPMPQWEPNMFPKWIISDVRFVNEADYIKSLGGIIIRVNRPGTKPANNHISDMALDTYKGFNYTVENDSDIADLHSKIESILKIEKII